MARATLKEVVEHYMRKTNGFSIDSEEATSVAYIGEEVFYRICQAYRDLQFMETILQLDALGDLDRPNQLRIPNNVTRIQDSKIRYNCTDTPRGITNNYRDVQYLPVQEFLDIVLPYTGLNSNKEDVQDTSGFVYSIRTDKHPSYCTSFDGVVLSFDSYKKDEDSTLQNSKSVVHVSEEPVFLIQDDFNIPLPDHLIGLYRDGVLSEASETVRQ